MIERVVNNETVYFQRRRCSRVSAVARYGQVIFTIPTNCPIEAVLQQLDVARIARDLRAREAQRRANVFFMGRKVRLERSDHFEVLGDVIKVEDLVEDDYRNYLENLKKHGYPYIKKIFDQVALLFPEHRVPTLVATLVSSFWGQYHFDKHQIKYNARLLCYPEAVIRYVFIHEFCHIKHRNHSGLFWREVLKYDNAQGRFILKRHLYG